MDVPENQPQDEWSKEWAQQVYIQFIVCHAANVMAFQIPVDRESFHPRGIFKHWNRTPAKAFSPIMTSSSTSHITWK